MCNRIEQNVNKMTHQPTIIQTHLRDTSCTILAMQVVQNVFQRRLPNLQLAQRFVGLSPYIEVCNRHKIELVP